MKNSPGILHLFSQRSHRIVIAHILKGDAIHLQDHITGLNATVLGHCPALHDGAHVDTIVTRLGRLAHNGYTEEVYRVHVESHGDYIQGHGGIGYTAEGGGLEVENMRVLNRLFRHSKVHGLLENLS